MMSCSRSTLIAYRIAQGASTQQAILLEVDDVSMVALASSNGLQIWQIDTQQKLLDWSLSSTSDATSDTFCRGIAMVQAADSTCVLCVGDALGGSTCLCLMLWIKRSLAAASTIIKQPLQLWQAALQAPREPAATSLPAVMIMAP